VASRRSAELYGLAVLAQDIEDDGENTTRFAVVRRAPGTGAR
jgi:prephenate dehydratase